MFVSVSAVRRVWTEQGCRSGFGGGGGGGVHRGGWAGVGVDSIGRL